MGTAQVGMQLVAVLCSRCASQAPDQVPTPTPTTTPPHPSHPSPLLHTNPHNHLQEAAGTTNFYIYVIGAVVLIVISGFVPLGLVVANLWGSCQDQVVSLVVTTSCWSPVAPPPTSTLS